MDPGSMVMKRRTKMREVTENEARLFLKLLNDGWSLGAIAINLNVDRNRIVMIHDQLLRERLFERSLTEKGGSELRKLQAGYHKSLKED
jgi:hypothetical protein